MTEGDVPELCVTVIEPDGYGFVVMLPDGGAVFACDASSAEQIAVRWYRERRGEDSADIEWR